MEGWLTELVIESPGIDKYIDRYIINRIIENTYMTE